MARFHAIYFTIIPSLADVSDSLSRQYFRFHDDASAISPTLMPQPYHFYRHCQARFDAMSAGAPSPRLMRFSLLAKATEELSTRAVRRFLRAPLFSSARCFCYRRRPHADGTQHGRSPSPLSATNITTSIELQHDYCPPSRHVAAIITGAPPSMPRRRQDITLPRLDGLPRLRRQMVG